MPMPVTEALGHTRVTAELVRGPADPTQGSAGPTQGSVAEVIAPEDSVEVAHLRPGTHRRRRAAAATASNTDRVSEN